MKLDPTEARHVYWGGALKAGLKGLLVGVAVGLICAGALYGITAFAAAQGFTALTGIAQFVRTTGGGFTALPLMVFNGVIASVAAFFSGGSATVQAYHQQKHNNLQMVQEQRLDQLEMRQHAVEQTLDASRTVKDIVATGPRNAASFAQREQERAENPAPPTLH